MSDSTCIGKLNGINGNSHNIKNTHLTSVCTKLENSLADRKINYIDKVNTLLQAWVQIVQFVSESSTESPQPYFDIFFLSTLRLVLRADWKNTIQPALKTHLEVTLQRFIDILRKSDAYHSILEQSRVLKSLIKDPWEQDALKKILNSQDADINDCFDYFRLENGKVVSLRLEMLLESKCEDLAINLSKACINTNRNFNEDLEGFDTLEFTQDEIDYILDIYFSCLAKKKRTQEIIDEIKRYELNEGLILLKRYRQHSVGGKAKERCKNARVWKCNDKIIHLLSETLLAKAVLHGDSSESQSELESIIEEWVAIRTVDGVLPTVALEGIRKFVLIAPSSETIYPFCSLLLRNGKCKEQYFDTVARCLIRAIIQNINEVEQLRVNKEREKLKQMYCQLSKGFLLLSDLLTECRNIYKECLLTSFSLTPTRECLQTIEAFVTQLANIADPPEKPTPELNSTNEPVPPLDSSSTEVEKSTSVDGTVTATEPVSNQPENSSTQTTETVLDSQSPPENSCPGNSTSKIDTESETLPDAGPSNTESEAILSSSVTKAHDTSELNENIAKSETNDNQSLEDSDSIQVSRQVDSELKNLKLDEDMDEDLNIILNYRRSHTLTWDLSWPELKANCEKYLENFEKKDFDDVELKYLDLDYNLYKDKPINYDDTYGIEKGYEHYAYSASDSEEEVSSTKKSGVSSLDSDEDTLLIYRKRKKVINSDSDEPKIKKKRGRKPKPKSEEPSRRNSLKSDTGSNTEDDKILNTIESVIAESSSSADNLKELRSFRIRTGDNGESFIDDNHNESVISEEDAKKYEELNKLLEESCKSLECVEIPPIPPKFNVYDVILDDTLVPAESEKRLPKCEDLLRNNENCFVDNFTPFEAKKRPEKPRKSAAKEKNPNRRKRPPKASKGVTFATEEAYLEYLEFTAKKQATLLSKNELFKRKYGSNVKTEALENQEKINKKNELFKRKFCSKVKTKPLENQDKNNTNLSPMVQLPKLCETFNKKSFAMKPMDPMHNFSFTSYLTESLDNKPSISQLYYGTTNQNGLNNNSFASNPSTAVNHSYVSNPSNVVNNSFASNPSNVVNNNSFASNPSNVVNKSFASNPSNVVNNNSFASNPSNVVNNSSSGENIEDIANFIKSFETANYTPTQPTTTSSVLQRPARATVDSMCQTDFCPSDVDDLHGVLDSASSNFTNSPCTSESSVSISVQNNIHELMPATSTSINVSPPVINETARAPFSYHSNNVRRNIIPPKKTETKKIDQILHEYQKKIAAHPELQNVPAPRKRNNSNTPRKSRSRKKDLSTMKKPDGYVGNMITNSVNSKPVVSQQISSPIPNGNVAAPVDSYLANNSDLLYDTSPAKLPIIYDASQIIQVPGERLPYQANVAPAIPTKIDLNQFDLNQLPYPRVEVQRINPSQHRYSVSPNTKVNGVNKFASSANQNVLKTLLTQKQTPNRQYNPSPSASSTEVKLQMPSPSREIQLNVNSAKKYYNANTAQEPPVSQPVYSSQLTNGQQYNPPTTTFSRSPQQPKTTQNLRGCEGMKSFQVRIPRIDSKIDVKNYSTNNSHALNKTNLPPVRNLLPQVLLPIISISDAMRNTNTSDSNYQTANNFNPTSTSTAGLTEVTQSNPNVNNYEVLNDVNMSSQFSSQVLPATSRDNKSESNTFWYGTINTENPEFNTISIPEGSYSLGEFEYLNL